MFAGAHERAARAGMRVRLSGEGGDEWLDGSRGYYAAELAARNWSAVRECLESDVATYGARQSLKWLGRHGVFPLLPAVVQRGLRKVVHVARGPAPSEAYWLSPHLRAVLSRRRETFAPPRRPGLGPVQRSLLASLEDAHSIQVMERAERLASAFGVELRYPFRTTRFVQRAFSTPERLRLRGDRTKYVHVQALREFLPSAVLERRTKAEFSVVFREHLDAMAEELTQTIPRAHGDWVSPTGMKQLYQVYRDRPDLGWPIWPLWSLFGCDRVMTPVARSRAA